MGVTLIAVLAGVGYFAVGFGFAVPIGYLARWRPEDARVGAILIGWPVVLPALGLIALCAAYTRHKGPTDYQFPANQ